VSLTENTEIKRSATIEPTIQRRSSMTPPRKSALAKPNGSHPAHDGRPIPPTPQRSISLSRHQLTDSGTISPGRPAKPIITFDLAESERPNLEKNSRRRRSNSESHNESDRPVIKSSPSFPPRLPGSTFSQAEENPVRRGSLISHLPARVLSEPLHTLVSREKESDTSHSNSNYSGNSNGNSANVGGISRFFRELPNILHRTSIFAADNDHSGADGDLADEVKPRRHLKGEVVCLHYGTIDDNGYVVFSLRVFAKRVLQAAFCSHLDLVHSCRGGFG